MSVSFLIPSRDSAKSYRTGSCGTIVRNASVISMAVFMSACLRFVNPNERQMLCKCVSSGTTRCKGDISSHPPGSTSSRRTIHRKKRLSLLHALPLEGTGSKLLQGLLNPALNSFTNEEIAGKIDSLSSVKEDLKHAWREPYLIMTFLIPNNIAARSSPFVNLCLKPEYVHKSDSMEDSLMNREGEGTIFRGR